ncbi:arginine-glutamic acid dipeptide repeats protein-like [Teratosphaeria destructans]|uniref:Arginine-glutamic acid dipeptide repeats protein-like n=1 Tax=Teratosphaeria destructans TaxID=418781 RepID=A0A9W7W172_9PEZI|nr:arginine-glutamic acid dipeptide repeats protein-like [Teratosphaeria destructans]
MDAGGLARMSYNNGNGYSSGGLGAPGNGFGNRTRLSNKRLSVALPPKVDTISEGAAVENPTPRTSRSHLLAGLRTRPKTPAVSASAPYHQTEHQAQGLGASRWADQSYGNGYGQVPQTATGTGFNLSNHGTQYAINAGQQVYSLPEQVLAPPTMYEQYDQVEEMDPAVLQQMQMTSLYLAQRQQQLQQQLASLTMATQGMTLNNGMQRNMFQQPPMTSQTLQNMYGQQQIQSPIEIPGQPGVYLVYNPATQGYQYAIDHSAHQQQISISPVQQNLPSAFQFPQYEASASNFQVSPPGTERSTPTNGPSLTPPKKAPSPPSSEPVEPLPPPSANAFRRGHNKGKSSLSINPFAKTEATVPQTASAATFGSQRSTFPATPMTGTFGPGAARAGDHPVRQPRGPPPLEELVNAPTTKHEGSKNFATRQRRRALNSLMRAGIGRRGLSRSSGGSPVSESEYYFPIMEEAEETASFGSGPGSRKMSPIGYEMKEKRSSQGSNDGYFGLSSASSSEGEEMGVFKQPPTPATPGGLAPGMDRKMMLGVLSAAEKRRNFV